MFVYFLGSQPLKSSQGDRLGELWEVGVDLPMSAVTWGLLGDESEAKDESKTKAKKEGLHRGSRLEWLGFLNEGVK